MQSEWEGTWYGVSGIHLVPKFNYRIHPEDAHLAYGPVSTALREMAEQYVYSTRWENKIAEVAATEFTVYFDSQSPPDYPLFYLFLAEFLADFGL